MKPAMKRMISYFFNFFTIILILTISQSCGKKQKAESTVSDFTTLKSLFSEPPAEYTTSPFFVWDDDINADEIDRFMEEFHRQGSSQVFVHPRPGLVTEYLSEKWFDLFRHTVDKGKELGMKVWIYDENSYPSGFAGGHVPAEMPESYNQGQGLKMIKTEIIPDTADKFYLILKEENGNYSDITTNTAAEKGKTGKYCLFYKTYNGKSDWYGGFSYVDLLYPGVTQKFIDITMKGYEKIAGDEFGKTVPGTFTDEPQIESPGGIRFTPDLFNEFREKWGYDLRLNLPSLFEETGDWKRIRHNYTQTLLDLFIERWAIPWSEYCESKNLKFTGHYWEHEWPNMQPGGDNMAMYLYHQEPAIDMLFNQFNDSLPGAQFGNVRSVKELASAANQSGRSRKLSETYGGSGWDLTFTDMKRNGDWEYALGVNQMNQHLTYFSMEGARKYDYPPTFDYHEPWWTDYKYINDHYARLSLALSSGRQVNDILILEPNTTCWMYDSYVERNKKVGEIGQVFQTFVTSLEKNQVEYDLGSERILSETGSVKDGKLHVGFASYSKVVIPPMTENLNLKTLELLKKFESQGGKIIACSVPFMVDGKENKEAEKVFSGRNVSMFTSGSAASLAGELSNATTSFSNVRGELYHQTRKLNDGELVFLVNSGLNDSLTGNLNVKGAGVIEMNTLTGELNSYPFSQEGSNITLGFALPPAGSLLLFIPDKKTDGYPGKKLSGQAVKLPLAQKISAKADSANVLTIDFCDLTIGNETARDLYFWAAADMAYRKHGLNNGNPWNTSVQYKTNIVDRDTFNVKTGFTATYHFNVKGRFDYSGLKAIIERPSLWTVKINGTEIKAVPGKWWLDRNFGVFEIGKNVREGENLISITASPMRIFSEIESIYITGDFSLEPAAKGWSIKAPIKSIEEGSWQSQGMPFYSWGVSYSGKFDSGELTGSYQVSLPEWKGTVAEISVNGKKAAIVAFPPYRADITAFLVKGLNEVTVNVKGSLRNLEGPFHNNPPVGFASPWNWRYIKTYPSGKDYKMYDYGLLKDFEILRSE